MITRCATSNTEAYICISTSHIYLFNGKNRILLNLPSASFAWFLGFRYHQIKLWAIWGTLKTIFLFNICVIKNNNILSVGRAVNRQYAFHNVRLGRASASSARVARLLPGGGRDRVPGGRVRPPAPARVQGRAGLTADRRDPQQLPRAHPRQQDRQTWRG